MSQHADEQAVSVIVGTLLLILITVTAAAGLAVMVSQMQKDEMNRQSHLAAVNSEKIQIVSVSFANDDDTWNKPPFNMTNSGNWSSVTLNLVNLNIDDVRVIGIAFNDRYTRNFTTLTDSPVTIRTPFNISNNEFLTIPGTQNQKIQVNFTDDFPVPVYIGTRDQVKIRIMTSLYNTFERTLKPPNPIIQSGITSEDLGVTQRDVLVLDGSHSTTGNNNTLVSWNWSIANAIAAVPSGYCGNVSNLTDIDFSQGQVIRYNPDSAGPFCINLTVTDDIGMTATSGYVSIPVNSRFSPPTNFNAAVQKILDPDGKYYNYLNVTITDINGNPVPGAAVNYIIEVNPFGNLTLSNYVGTTDSKGTNSSKVLNNGTGTIKILSGSFTPIELAVSG